LRKDHCFPLLPSPPPKNKGEKRCKVEILCWYLVHILSSNNISRAILKRKINSIKLIRVKIFCIFETLTLFSIHTCMLMLCSMWHQHNQSCFSFPLTFVIVMVNQWHFVFLPFILRSLGQLDTRCECYYLHFGTKSWDWTPLTNNWNFT
jgi:hypothetical protein